jgi:hypothetical protein
MRVPCAVLGASPRLAGCLCQAAGSEPAVSPARGEATGGRPGHLRRGLLLVHGAALRQARRACCPRRRATPAARSATRPTRTWPRAARAMPKWSRWRTTRAHQLRGAASRVLAQHRSLRRRPPVLRCRAGQYRSAIFYHDDSQRAAAEASLAEVAAALRSRGIAGSGRWATPSIRPRNTTRTTTSRTRSATATTVTIAAGTGAWSRSGARRQAADGVCKAARSPLGRKNVR